MALITKRFCSLHSGVDWSVQSGPGKCPKRPGKISETALNLMRLLFSCFTQNLIKGPSIYDVHTEVGRGQAQVDAYGRGRGGPAPCGRPHRKLKLESTDVILSFSHAKKFASFLPEFRLWTEKSGNFSAI